MNGRKRVLLIEDEAGLVLTLTDRLEAEGYEVRSSRDGSSGFRTALEDSFDLLLVDVMLPGKNGFDICRDLRAQGKKTPIIMITARGEIPDRVVGLKLGADDYLAKPFDMLELLARMEAVQRRTAEYRPGTSERFLRSGDLELDREAAVVRKNGREVALTAQEYRLLLFFMEHPDAVHSRDRLLDEVWGYEADITSRTVDVHIASLRQKLETNPAHPCVILTVRTFGYRFSPA